MKKLMLMGLFILVVMYPAMVLAGSVYWNADATFHNDAKFTKPGLRGAKGSATVRYNVSEWTVELNFSGLLKNHEYIFQFSLEDQLMIRYDCEVTTDSKGKLKQILPIMGLDSAFAPDYLYSILRLLDLSGDSGGIKLSDLEPPETNPYWDQYPNATMVMRAREDGVYGQLTFFAP